MMKIYSFDFEIMTCLRILQALLLVGLGSYQFAYAAFGNHPVNPTPQSSVQEDTEPVTDENAVEERAQQEEKVAENPFAISFYQPTYVLPFNYTQWPDNSVYNGQTPNGQPISHYDVKFQFSLKYPVWNFSDLHKLYIAYTQMSYWQAYQSSAFFRETNYEPEIFLANEIDKPLGGNWQANFFNIGAMHQSNGEGGSLERSWNRVYVNLIGGTGNLMVQVQPWYIFHDNSMETHNPDIGHYMGYEQVVVAYKYHEQEFSVQARNTVESLFQRPGITLAWSFPTGIRHLKGYLQVFTGYGESLLQYNQYNNSIGLGVSLSDWL